MLDEHDDTDDETETDSEPEGDDTSDASATAGPAPFTNHDQPADPTRIVIEQAPPEPAVFYGDGGLVPGTGHATDQNKPHVKANYQSFDW